MKYQHLSSSSFNNTSQVKTRHVYRGVGGSLAELFRTIQYDLNISGPRMEVCISEFIIAEKRRIPDNRVARFLVRGNIRRELDRPSMTFKVFIKMLKIIGVKQMDFGVELDFGQNKTQQNHLVHLDLKAHSNKSIQLSDDIHSVSSSLSFLWNKIKDAQAFDAEKFDHLLAEFIRIERKKIEDKRVAKLFTKGNVRRELEKPSMTFKVFIKGLRVLGVKRVRVFVNVQRTNSGMDKQEYSTFVNFNNTEDFDETEDTSQAT
jgi:hypothetical protein